MPGVASISARTGVLVRSNLWEQTCGKFKEFKQRPEKFKLTDN